MTNTISERHRCDRRRESGAALLVSILLLTAMTLIGFASLNTVMRDREVTGATNRSQTALYGADAAVAATLELLRTTPIGTVKIDDCLTPDVPSGTLPNGVSYGPDTTASPPPKVCLLSAGKICENYGSNWEMGNGGSVYREAIWSVRAQGVAPGGATSRVQATIQNCVAFGTGG